MSDTFKKKLMHPTRKKLVDMVLNGEYDKNLIVSKPLPVESLIEEKSRTQVSDILSSARKYLSSKKRCKDETCNFSDSYSRADEKLIRMTGYCAGCLSKLEARIYSDGNWDTYVKYRITSNAIIEGEGIIENLLIAIQNVDELVSGKYFDEHGREETWSSGQNPEELTSDIQKDIELVLSDLTELRLRKSQLQTELNQFGYDKL